MQNRFIGSVIAAGAVAGGWGAHTVQAQAATGVNQTRSFDAKASGSYMPLQQAPIMTEAASTYSKVEVDAKFEAQAAKAETARVGLEGKLDRVLDAVSGLKSDLAREIGAVKADNKNTRGVIAGVFIGTVLAALAALWATQSNLLSAFSAGLSAHPPAESIVAPQAAPASK